MRGASLSPDGGRVVAEVGGRRLEAAVLGSAAAGGGGGVPVEHTLDLWLNDGEHFHFTCVLGDRNWKMGSGIGKWGVGKGSEKGKGVGGLRVDERMPRWAHALV